MHISLVNGVLYAIRGYYQVDGLAEILNKYTLVELILLFCGLVIAAKVIGQAIEWVMGKARGRFSKEEEDTRQSQRIETELSNLSEGMLGINNRLSAVERSIDNINTNQIDDMRIYLIDKYKYYKSLGRIDEMSHQLIESKYVTYKRTGGDTYIDGIMNEIRALPKVDAENATI